MHRVLVHRANTIQYDTLTYHYLIKMSLMVSSDSTLFIQLCLNMSKLPKQVQIYSDI